MNPEGSQRRAISRLVRRHIPDMASFIYRVCSYECVLVRDVHKHVHDAHCVAYVEHSTPPLFSAIDVRHLDANIRREYAPLPGLFSRGQDNLNAVTQQKHIRCHSTCAHVHGQICMHGRCAEWVLKYITRITRITRIIRIPHKPSLCQHGSLSTSPVSEHVKCVRAFVRLVCC